MLFQTSFLALQVIAPLVAHLRGWSPAALFAVTAGIYAFFAAIGLAGMQLALRALREADPAYGDTYYVFSTMPSAAGFALIMACFAAITWAQTRFGAMLYPTITKTLFWALHLGMLGLTASVTGLWTAAMGPRRYVDYPEFMTTLVTVQMWSWTVAVAAAVGLAVLLVVSSTLVARGRFSGQ